MSAQLDIFGSSDAEGPPPPEGPPADTDCGWLLRLLWDGRERTLNEILRASFDERGCGMTVHSRVSDLRTRYGFRVEWRHEPGATRGNSSVYRLVR